MITHSQVAMIGSMGQGASLSGNTGIKVPDFSDDGGNASVPGRKLKILKLASSKLILNPYDDYG